MHKRYLPDNSGALFEVDGTAFGDSAEDTTEGTADTAVLLDAIVETSEMTFVSSTSVSVVATIVWLSGVISISAPPSEAKLNSSSSRAALVYYIVIVISC